MGVVEPVLRELTPISKPSLSTQRWWSSDLTELRTRYCRLRNRAKEIRRYQLLRPELWLEVLDAKRRFCKAIRAQKKAYWEDFVAEETNI